MACRMGEYLTASICYFRPKRELREQALIILCYMASEEPAAKQMVEGGILEEICSHNPEEVVQKEVNLMANMSSMWL